ncbi:MAG TPA: (deoxy)nucleoside triphosphate pyrophosphohydrolase [Acidobacteriota bacterium]|nr:(deoxy)nucleoside triphosphate pyrophosphohydrolase [Acidobacteriota bacterium]
MNDTPQLVLVVAAIIVDQERILITQRLPSGRLANQWEFPGGKVNWGEPPEDALRREIQEELGLDVEVGAPVHLIHYALNTNQAFAVVFYWSRIAGGTLELIGCQAARWITVNEFPKVDFLQANLPVVEILKARVAALGSLSPTFSFISCSHQGNEH